MTRLVICVIHDRVASIDSIPRFYNSTADAIRGFQRDVNMPSENMLFHAPGDFELTQVGEAHRGDKGNFEMFGISRNILITGSAALNETMRDGYLRMSTLIKEEHNAPQQVS